MIYASTNCICNGRGTIDPNGVEDRVVVGDPCECLTAQVHTKADFLRALGNADFRPSDDWEG